MKRLQSVVSKSKRNEQRKSSSLELGVDVIIRGGEESGKFFELLLTANLVLEHRHLEHMEILVEIGDLSEILFLHLDACQAKITGRA